MFPGCHTGRVSRTFVGRGRSATRMRQPALRRFLPGAAGSLLAVPAFAEFAVTRDIHGWAAQYAVVVVFLCLFSTLPAALLRPTPAWLAVAAAGVASLAIFQTVPVAGMAAQLIAAYRLGRSGWPPLAVGTGVPFLIVAVLDPGGRDLWVRMVLLASLPPAVALAGAVQRARAEAIANHATREVMADTLLEHVVRGERARIARELHDVVAHHISMVAVQAETARLTTPGLPPSGAKQLLSIGDTARAALTEMRRLLGVLREDAAPASEGRHPQPGLGQLNELLDEARDAAGTAARLIVSGPVRSLDPGVELIVYRIVQESLTNVRRHAPGAAIDVEICYDDEWVRVRVRDNGPGPVSGTFGGHGLLGMRERATTVGGVVRTGPAYGGGFLVEVNLPVQTEDER
jgi:signal transduction histidine kinase